MKSRFSTSENYLDGVFKSTVCMRIRRLGCSSLEPTHSYFGICGLQLADDRKFTVFLRFCFCSLRSSGNTLSEYRREHQPADGNANRSLFVHISS